VGATTVTNKPETRPGEPTEDSTINPVTVSPTGLDHHLLDPDAVRALQRLRARGLEAYLVGGCVRDLLVGLKPKDFDIATSARPQQMKRVFPRNCRIIGRRFKLAHLHFHGNTKILEAATFRRTPEGVNDDAEDDDLLIVRDNEFGSAEEDAVRRDFTVNALFFDPLDDRIIDYVGGLADVHARVIRTIGDPETRFREDPVRILRAAKFAGRLGFAIDDPAYKAMKVVASDLTRAAPPRLLEEVLRLLRGGHALDSFQILRDVQALPVILPVVGDYLAAAEADERVLFWRTLESLDNRIRRGDVPSNALLLGALFNRPILALLDTPGHRSATTIAEEVIAPFALDLRLPRRDAGCLKRICGVQTRFTASGRRRFRMSSFLQDPYFPEALELFELTCRASGEGLDQLERWRQLHAEAGGPQAGEEAADPRETTIGAATATADAAVEPDAARGRDPRRRKRSRSRRKKAAAREGAAKNGGANGATEAAEPAKKKAGKATKKKTAKKTRTSTKKKTAAAKAEESGGKNDKKRKPRRARKKAAAGEREGGREDTAGRQKRKRSGSRKQDEVKTLEPEPMDLSAFDVELDPKRVPTFTSIVEGEEQADKKRRRPRLPKDDDDTYKPPPPPGTDQEHPPAPPADDDVFGDW
jgi:poly(A) polymerase